MAIDIHYRKALLDSELTASADLMGKWDIFSSRLTSLCHFPVFFIGIVADSM
jgi:hypothetical protein